MPNIIVGNQQQMTSLSRQVRANAATVLPAPHGSATWLCIDFAQQPEKYAAAGGGQTNFEATYRQLPIAIVHPSAIQHQFGQTPQPA
ncbi:MAG TPA: hypothetical protein VKW08_06155 [Xanthobacteraceae bacterium]|nr:hypothetical protein [Xanthobacteraceae bacterium]